MLVEQFLDLDRHLADAFHRQGHFVGHDDAECVFEGEEQVRGVERIETELLERGLAGDLRRVQLFLARDDRDNLLHDVVRHSAPFATCWKS